MKVAKVNDHYSYEEIENLMKEYKNNSEVYIRLLFILNLLKNNKIKDIAPILNIHPVTGSTWLKNYNEYGLEGLIPNHHLSGRKCLLSDNELIEIKAEINKEDSYYSIKDIQKLIKNKYGISYSYKQVWHITRVKLGFNYGKPFINYTERDEELFEEFKKKIKKIILNMVYLGFLDQSYFQNLPNVSRILFEGQQSKKFFRTGQKFGISVTGILGVNCESFMETYKRNNSYTTILTFLKYRSLNMENEKIKELLENIYNNPKHQRESIENELTKQIPTKEEKLDEIYHEINKNRKNKNTTFNQIEKICNQKSKITPQKISIIQRNTIKQLLIESNVEEILKSEKSIVLIADNAKIHHAKDVKKVCEILNIELMHIPPYSPELNPIEDLWKIIKKNLYTKDYKDLNELIDIIIKEFYENASSNSLYKNWIDEFISSN